MNPIKAIEKWINEHASAEVLEKHIALLKTQTAILEKENASLRKENKKLKRENAKLNQQAEITKALNQPFPQPGLIHNLDKPRRVAN